MTAYIMRIQGPKGRYWVVYNEDASIIVRTAKSKKFALSQLAEKADLKISKTIRYKGVLRSSEAAFTIADARS